MLIRFLKWWGSELAGMLPAALAGRGDAGQWLHVELGGPRQRAVLEGARERVLLDVPAGEATRLHEELAAAVAGVDGRRVRCRVTLPARDVLVRDLDLPLAAQENLREVLGFEMSRNTPFRSDDVHFDYQELGRDAARQRLQVRLHVVPRTRLAPVLSALQGWDPQPARVPAAAREAAEQAGRAAFAFRASGYQERPHAVLNTLLALLVAALAVAVLWLPFAEQRAYRERLEEEARAAMAQAEQASRLRDRLEAEHAARLLITGARSGRPAMVELMEEISRVLPDNTFLYRLEIGQEQVNLHGSSEAASALIAILEATPHLASARFASPVTRDGATARERFHIIADLARREAARAGGG